MYSKNTARSPYLFLLPLLLTLFLLLFLFLLGLDATAGLLLFGIVGIFLGGLVVLLATLALLHGLSKDILVLHVGFLRRLGGQVDGLRGRAFATSRVFALDKVLSRLALLALLGPALAESGHESSTATFFLLGIGGGFLVFGFLGSLSNRIDGLAEFGFPVVLLLFISFLFGRHFDGRGSVAQVELGVVLV